MKMLDLLLNKMNEHVTGDPNSRLYCTKDDWDVFHEGDDWSYCHENDHDICGDIFPVKDLVKNITLKSSFYSFRDRHGYPKLKDLTEDSLIDLFCNWLQSVHFYCSPFGCGSDQEWGWEVFELNGQKFIFTYSYVGS